MNYINILTISITLFAIINMIGNIPLIIKLREEYGEIESLKGSIISTVIMIVFLFFGKTLFNILGIETYHFGLAGAFLIIYFGVKMVLGIQESDKKQQKKAMKATIFPIAFPLIAGPGTLSVIISMRSEYTDIEIIMGILINAVVIFTVLKSAEWVKNKIGVTGITIIERIFGIILISIGSKMLLYNLILRINEVLDSTAYVF